MANRLDLRFTSPAVEALWLRAQPSTHGYKDVLAGILLLIHACVGISRNVHWAGELGLLVLLVEVGRTAKVVCLSVFGFEPASFIMTDCDCRSRVDL